MSPQQQQALDEIVRRISGQFHPEQIILFGSQARDQGNSDSDFDLLVIMRPQGSRRQQAIAIDRALLGINCPTDIIVATPDDIAQQRDQIGSIIRPAMREGKVVYDRCA